MSTVKVLPLPPRPNIHLSHTILRVPTVQTPRKSRGFKIQSLIPVTSFIDQTEWGRTNSLEQPSGDEPLFVDVDRSSLFLPGGHSQKSLRRGRDHTGVREEDQGPRSQMGGDV